LLQIILIVAFVSALAAIAALHSAQSRSGRYGRLGAIGALIAFIGYALIATVTAVTAAVGFESLYSVRVIAGLAVLIGSLLLGIMTIRARVLPWWCGALLIVGFPLGDILDVVVGEGSEGIMFGILWASVGYVLLSHRRPAEPPR